MLYIVQVSARRTNCKQLIISLHLPKHCTHSFHSVSVWIVKGCYSWGNESTQEYCICYHIHPWTEQNCIQHNVNVNSVHIALHLRKFRLFYPTFYSVILYNTLFGVFIQNSIRCFYPKLYSVLLSKTLFCVIIENSILCYYRKLYSVFLSKILFGVFIENSIRYYYTLLYSMLLSNILFGVWVGVVPSLFHKRKCLKPIQKLNTYIIQNAFEMYVCILLASVWYHCMCLVEENRNEFEPLFIDRNSYIRIRNTDRHQH